MTYRIASYRAVSLAQRSMILRSTGGAGSGSHHGGGGGGNVRSGGGTLGERAHFMEESYFRKKNQEELEHMREHIEKELKRREQGGQQEKH
eukprot:Clim_evm90s153 gene=Clim_evmTU90s153